MEIEDVQNQMRDEGCDDLSELNQIIELDRARKVPKIICFKR